MISGFIINRNLDGVDDLLIPIKVIGTTDEDIRNNIIIPKHNYIFFKFKFCG